MNAFSMAFLDTFPPDPLDDAWISSASGLQIPGHEGPQEIPPWERLPLHVGPTTPLDSVLLGLFQSTRQHVQNSGHIEEFSQPAFPSIRSLLNPDSQNAHSPISNAIGQHGRITMEVPDLAVKIGMMYNMCVLLRWLVSPTKRNYEAMPEYLRPVESQLTVLHPIWIDVVVW